MSYPALAEEVTASDPNSVGHPASQWLSVVTHLDPRYGGLSAVVPQLCSVVASTGHLRMSLAAFCSTGELYSASNFAGLTLSEWPASRRSWMTQKHLRQDFSELLRGADGLHIHGLWEQSTMVAAGAARTHHIPYILSAHGMLERWALGNKRIKKMLYSALVERANVQGASCLHALTHAEAEDYRRYGATGPIAVIPNGVRIPEHLSSDLFLSQHPALKGKRIVLFLGRIHYKKGLDLLIQAWRRISAQSPEVHLVLAGPDFEGTRSKIAAQIEEYGLGNSVLFTGMLRDELKWSALAAAECFVLPSYSEGLSVSVLEAMGIGLPVIVSENCNLPEVGQLEAGWVIPAELRPLQYALNDLLDNSPATNRQIGARGRSFIRQRYTWSGVGSQMRQVYSWVQGGAPPQDVEVLYPRSRR